LYDEQFPPVLFEREALGFPHDGERPNQLAHATKRVKHERRPSCRRRNHL
jgi:hypothetical protein